MTPRFKSETERIAQYLPRGEPEAGPLRVIHGGLEDVRGADDALDWVEETRERRPGRSAGARVALKAFVVLTVFLLAGAGYLLAVDRSPVDALWRGVAAMTAAGADVPQAAAAAAAQSAPSAFPQVVQSAPAAVPPAIPIPDMNGLGILVRNAVMALQQANETGNYSVLREIAAPAFQEANTPARLSDVFADVRARGLDLGAVMVVNPVLYQPPAIDEQGMLRLVGHFDEGTADVAFDLIFQRLDTGWRLFGIGVNPDGGGAAGGKVGEAAARAETGPPEVPDAATMVVLIRGAIVALNQANLTGNYSVMRELAAPGFQQANSFADLSAIFADLRGRQIDLGPIAVIDPQLFLPAAIDQQGMLRLTGFFASRPEQVNFDLAFQRVSGDWRLFGIGVNTSIVVPTAEAPPEPPSAPVESTAAEATATSAGVPLPPQPRLRPGEPSVQ